MADLVRAGIAGTDLPERPNIVIRPELQRALDTAYQRAGEPAEPRFARQLRADDDADVAASGAVALTVAIARVVNDAEVLLVCRREADPSGLTWGFPQASSSRR